MVFSAQFRGITPSFAFVGEPETNGGGERFTRTLREAITHGHTLRNHPELDAAVSGFFTTYNPNGVSSVTGGANTAYFWRSGNHRSLETFGCRKQVSHRKKKFKKSFLMKFLRKYSLGRR